MALDTPASRGSGGGSGPPGAGALHPGHVSAGLHPGHMCQADAVGEHALRRPWAGGAGPGQRPLPIDLDSTEGGPDAAGAAVRFWGFGEPRSAGWTPAGVLTGPDQGVGPNDNGMSEGQQSFRHVAAYESSDARHRALLSHQRISRPSSLFLLAPLRLDRRSRRGRGAPRSGPCRHGCRRRGLGV